MRPPALLCASLLVAVTTLHAQQPAKYPNYPSETPQVLHEQAAGRDFDRRDVMIPVRDGVKLHAVILVPAGARHAGIVLTVTPYNANLLSQNTPSLHLASALFGYDNAVESIVPQGYIRAIVDVRGKYGSEGDYVMNRPVHGPLNPTPVDDSTDTYDVIDWLVKNIPETNGRVATIGISYDGFEPLMSIYHPHPALKAAVPMNPMVDGWRGDDWFHNGAFRQQNITYIYEQAGTRSNEMRWLSSDFDDYNMYMRAVSAGALAKQRGMEQIGFWNKLSAHPAYDSFWSEQAVDRLLSREPLTVPTLLVHSLWDAEDIYGAIAVYKALAPKDPDHTKLYLAIGPWHHGQEIDEDVSSLGPIKFRSDTGLYFREQILAPFLAHYLQDSAPELPIAPVTAFVTGENRWEKLDAWPKGCESGCSITPARLYLGSSNTLSMANPASRDSPGYDEFVSDPAKPVPYRSRPSQPMGYTPNLSWARWLVDDQREFSGRTDVLTYTGEVLTKPVKISGEPIANIVASTTGTDADWVVKLIDVYPDEVAGQPELGGYQLAVSMDIFRGRYRESLAQPKPVPAGTPLPYRFALPTTNHVFLPGHRIMVQIQSSWFPLYDRNPQTFVPNILFADPSAYRKQTERIYRAPGQESYIQLPLVAAAARP